MSRLSIVLALLVCACLLPSCATQRPVSSGFYLPQEEDLTLSLTAATSEVLQEKEARSLAASPLRTPEERLIM